MTHITDNNDKPARFNGNTSDWISPDISVYEIISDINTSTLDIKAELISSGIIGGQYIAQIEVTELIAGTFTEGTAAIYTTDDHVSFTETRSFTAGDFYSERNLGLQYYELSNHPNTFEFGNVMEVITDRKITVDDATFDALTGDLVTLTSDGVIDYFSSDIVQYSDYYPYGMTMPGRNGSVSEKYRYAFNGMETDQEVSGSGNSYTTQFRQYDPRLGRWKSLDPLAGKYPGQSAFCAFNNNPLYFVDPMGLEGTHGKPPQVDPDVGQDEKVNRVHNYKDPTQTNQQEYLDMNFSIPVVDQKVVFTYDVNQSQYHYNYNKTDNQWEVAVYRGGQLYKTYDPYKVQELKDKNIASSEPKVTTPTVQDDVKEDLNKTPETVSDEIMLKFYNNSASIEKGKDEFVKQAKEIAKQFKSAPNKDSFEVTIIVGTDVRGANFDNYNTKDKTIGPSIRKSPGSTNPASLIGPDSLRIDVFTYYTGKPLSVLLYGRWKVLTKILTEQGIPLENINQNIEDSIDFGNQNGVIQYHQ